MIRYYVKEIKKLPPKSILDSLGILRSVMTGGKSVTTDIFNKTLGITGFAYDPEQDIYYSNKNSWQRNFGFCRLYNEAAAPLRMIVDSEQIKFDYDNKKWSIQLWKGQYGITTGGEIGVFNTSLEDYNNSATKDQTLFKSANEEDMLTMSFSLIKNQRVMFVRQDRHWWLTGFVLGEFSEPYQLSMNVRITLKDEIMRDAFIQGLRDTGYADTELGAVDNTVIFTFKRPRTAQPSTRNLILDRLTQRANKKNCRRYQKYLGKYAKSFDKMTGTPMFAPKIRFEIADTDAVGQLSKLFSPEIGQKIANSDAIAQLTQLISPKINLKIANFDAAGQLSNLFGKIMKYMN